MGSLPRRRRRPMPELREDDTGARPAMALFHIVGRAAAALQEVYERDQPRRGEVSAFRSFHLSGAASAPPFPPPVPEHTAAVAPASGGVDGRSPPGGRRSDPCRPSTGLRPASGEPGIGVTSSRRASSARRVVGSTPFRSPWVVRDLVSWRWSRRGHQMDGRGGERPGRREGSRLRRARRRCASGEGAGVAGRGGRSGPVGGISFASLSSR